MQTTYVDPAGQQQGRWRTLATADYRVTLPNAGDSAVTVEVREERGGRMDGAAEQLVAAEKVSSTVTRFRVKVPARGEAVLTYRVRAVW